MKLCFKLFYFNALLVKIVCTDCTDYTMSSTHALAREAKLSIYSISGDNYDNLQGSTRLSK